MQPRIGHSGPPHDALSLQPGGCGNNDDLVAEPFRPRLKQKGDIEHDHRFASSASHRDEPLFGGSHDRMKNPLQLPQRLGLTENAAAQRRTVNPSCRIADAGKRRFDTSYRRPMRRQQTMNRRIRVEQGNPGLLQHPRRGTLPHADRAGKPQNNHEGLPGRG
jgi:hypothetical protein